MAAARRFASSFLFGRPEILSLSSTTLRTQDRIHHHVLLGNWKLLHQLPGDKRLPSMGDLSGALADVQETGDNERAASCRAALPSWQHCLHSRPAFEGGLAKAGTLSTQNFVACSPLTGPHSQVAMMQEYCSVIESDCRESCKSSRATSEREASTSGFHQNYAPPVGKSPAFSSPGPLFSSTSLTTPLPPCAAQLLTLLSSRVLQSKSPPLLHTRHFSGDHRKVLGARPKAAQGRALRLAVHSVNTVVEPYKKPTVLPLWRRWFTLEGWRVRKENVLSYLKTGYAVAKVKRAVPGYSVQLFFKDVTDNYVAVSKALAAGDLSALRPLVTDRVLGQMKQEVEVRQKGGWERVTWELAKAGSMQRRTVHGRLVGVNPKDTSMAFAQVTVRLQSLQKFAAYDRKGKLVAGSPDHELLVEDHWVMERPLWVKDAHWRLCGRLTL